VVGLCAGVGLAYFIEYMDTSIKTIEDIEQYISAPVLGVIPQKVKAFTADAPSPANAESYRVLRTNMRFSKKMTDGKKICCTSGSVGACTLSRRAGLGPGTRAQQRLDGTGDRRRAAAAERRPHRR
jgi:hypothetical protein